MVSQATVQAKTAFGFSKAASKLGAVCKWYRPNGPLNPLARQYGTQIAFFRPPVGPFVNPPPYGRHVYAATVNPSLLKIGDYLVEPNEGAFFIAALDPIAYPVAVRCNRTISISRPGAAPPGDDYYGGDIAADEVVEMVGWPASVTIKSRGSMGETRLPGDVRIGSFEILVPFGGMEIKVDDQITDEAGTRYTVSSPEKTSRGWRMLVEMAVL